jgi:putative ABC transport system ATP-binding protein
MTSLYLAGGRLHLREVTHGHGRLLVLVLAVLVLVAVVVVVAVAVRNARRRSRLRLPGEPEGGGPPPPAVAIHVDHLSKTYRLGRIPVRALDDISLDVLQGEMVCIMGKSGSGKSTLLRQLSLVDRPTAGTVLIHGREVTRLPEVDRAVLRLGGLGYVFQEYALLPELTALENVRLPALMLGRRGQDDRARAADLLRLVGLGDRFRHRPRELSGGEQQRVAIARAIVNHPRVVFADEPTANLDSLSATTVMETLRDLNRRLRVTIVFVSHDPDDARYATRVIRLADGKLVEAAA